MIFSDLVLEYKKKQQNFLQRFSGVDSSIVFQQDRWKSNLGYGITAVAESGEVIEKVACNFSHVQGASMPKFALSSLNFDSADVKSFEASGISIICHPKNPFVPTSHFNVRCFKVYLYNGDDIVWFGGGMDLTPTYINLEDCIFWHNSLKDYCDKFNSEYYLRYKKECDNYFFLPQYQQSRGVGGIFYDRLQDSCALDFNIDLIDLYQLVYRKIIEKNNGYYYNKSHKIYQSYRRGKYVEFNLMLDRGTKFGLMSGGRVESILVSMPPVVNWNINLDKYKKEEAILDRYFKPVNWLELVC